MEEIEVCEWKCDDEFNCCKTSCGKEWCFTEGGIEDNEVKYCFFCGKKVK